MDKRSVHVVRIWGILDRYFGTKILENFVMHKGDNGHVRQIIENAFVSTTRSMVISQLKSTSKTPVFHSLPKSLQTDFEFESRILYCMKFVFDSYKRSDKVNVQYSRHPILFFALLVLDFYYKLPLPNRLDEETSIAINFGSSKVRFIQNWKSGGNVPVFVSPKKSTEPNKITIGPADYDDVLTSGFKNNGTIDDYRDIFADILETPKYKTQYHVFKALHILNIAMRLIYPFLDFISLPHGKGILDIGYDLDPYFKPDRKITRNSLAFGLATMIGTYPDTTETLPSDQSSVQRSVNLITPFSLLEYKNLMFSVMNTIYKKVSEKIILKQFLRCVFLVDAWPLTNGEYLFDITEKYGGVAAEYGDSRKTLCYVSDTEPPKFKPKSPSAKTTKKPHGDEGEAEEQNPKKPKNGPNDESNIEPEYPTPVIVQLPKINTPPPPPQQPQPLNQPVTTVEQNQLPTSIVKPPEKQATKTPPKDVDMDGTKVVEQNTVESPDLSYSNGNKPAKQDGDGDAVVTDVVPEGMEKYENLSKEERFSLIERIYNELLEKDPNTGFLNVINHVNELYKTKLGKEQKKEVVEIIDKVYMMNQTKIVFANLRANSPIVKLKDVESKIQDGFDTKLTNDDKALIAETFKKLKKEDDEKNMKEFEKMTEGELRSAVKKIFDELDDYSEEDILKQLENYHGIKLAGGQKKKVIGIIKLVLKEEYDKETERIKKDSEDIVKEVYPKLKNKNITTKDFLEIIDKEYDDLEDSAKVMIGEIFEKLKEKDKDMDVDKPTTPKPKLTDATTKKNPPKAKPTTPPKKKPKPDQKTTKSTPSPVKNVVPAVKKIRPMKDIMDELKAQKLWDEVAPIVVSKKKIGLFRFTHMYKKWKDLFNAIASVVRNNPPYSSGLRINTEDIASIVDTGMTNYIVFTNYEKKYGLGDPTNPTNDRCSLLAFYRLLRKDGSFINEFNSIYDFILNDANIKKSSGKTVKIKDPEELLDKIISPDENGYTDKYRKYCVIKPKNDGDGELSLLCEALTGMSYLGKHGIDYRKEVVEAIFKSHKKNMSDVEIGDVQIAPDDKKSVYHHCYNHVMNIEKKRRHGGNVRNDKEIKFFMESCTDIIDIFIHIYRPRHEGVGQGLSTYVDWKNVDIDHQNFLGLFTRLTNQKKNMKLIYIVPFPGLLTIMSKEPQKVFNRVLMDVAIADVYDGKWSKLDQKSLGTVTGDLEVKLSGEQNSLSLGLASVNNPTGDVDFETLSGIQIGAKDDFDADTPYDLLTAFIAGCTRIKSNKKSTKELHEENHRKYKDAITLIVEFINAKLDEIEKSQPLAAIKK